MNALRQTKHLGHSVKLFEQAFDQLLKLLTDGIAL